MRILLEYFYGLVDEFSWNSELLPQDSLQLSEQWDRNNYIDGK